jgi:hypothetical protein
MGDILVEERDCNFFAEPGIFAVRKALRRFNDLSRRFSFDQITGRAPIEERSQ